MSNAALAHQQHEQIRSDLERDLTELIEIVHSAGRDDAVMLTVVQTTTQLLRQRQPRGSGLTAERARYLVESGTYTQQQIEDAERRIASGELTRRVQQTRVEAVSDSFSAAEVAAMLGREESTVRQRQGKGLLYSFVIGRARRYPSWQLVDGQPLPNLPALVAAFPEDMSHVTVRGFMTSPKSSLRRDEGQGNSDRPLSPAEWLAEGGDVQTVLDVLETYLAS